MVNMTPVILGNAFFLFSLPLAKCDTHRYLYSLIVNYNDLTFASLWQHSNRRASLIFFFSVSARATFIHPCYLPQSRTWMTFLHFLFSTYVREAFCLYLFYVGYFWVQGTHYSPTFLTRDYFKHLLITLGRAFWEGFSLLGTAPSPFGCSYILVFALCLLKVYLACVEP